MRASWIRVSLAVVAVCSSAASCASPDEKPMFELPRVTGSVAHRERIALPPSAVVEVRLEDVSRADAPAGLLGEQRIELAGRQVPIPFSVEYDPDLVDQRGRYALRATILVDGERLFTSTQAYLVLTGGHPDHADIVVQRVASATLDRDLTETYWRLTELDGAPVQVVVASNEPHFVLQGEPGRFHGAGGVNRLSGTYTLDGSELRLSPGPLTRMAGDPAMMAQESAFVAALPEITSYSIDGDSLVCSADGVPLLKFRAVDLP